MEKNNKHNHKMQINDLIDDAINNAIMRRGLVEEDLTVLPDDEIARVMGGSTNLTIAGFKPIKPPIEPICPPVKPPIIIKPPIKPICPPIIMGMIALPLDSDKLPSS